MEYHTAQKRNELFMHGMTRINLKDLMHQDSERGQIQKARYYMILLM